MCSSYKASVWRRLEHGTRQAYAGALRDFLRFSRIHGHLGQCGFQLGGWGQSIEPPKNVGGGGGGGIGKRAQLTGLYINYYEFWHRNILRVKMVNHLEERLFAQA